MNANPTPPTPDDSEHGSRFEDFINQDLDLDGLEEMEDASEPDALDPAEAGRILFEFQLPGGGPILKGAMANATGAPGGPAARLPQLPLIHDVRWQHVRWRQRPAKLRIYRPRLNWETHTGQLVLTPGKRAPSERYVIPDLRPGWTAVRYFTGAELPAELIDWRGNKASMHHLNLNQVWVSGYIRQSDMPPVRRYRPLHLLWSGLDVLILLLVVALLLYGASLVLDRLPLGEGPTVVELQHTIDTLEANVATLEAQLSDALADGGR